MPRALLAILLIGLSLSLYLPTWSPVGTWAHFGEDGPELEAAGRTLGIPHPTGYPLLMLLVRVIGLVVPPPISALNVVALLAAVAAVIAAGSAGRAIARRLDLPASAAGLLAGAFFAASYTWWRQAVIGEVYTLHLALFAGALAFIFAGGGRNRIIAGYLLGLGMTNHLETLPLLAVVLAILLLDDRLRRDRGASILAGAAFLLPLSLYAVLVLRSRLDPPFDWGNPETLRNLWWSLSGTPYRANLFRDGLDPFLGRWFDALATIAVVQLGGVGAALAALGLAGAWRRQVRVAFALVLLFVVTTFIAAAYAIPDPAAYALPAVLALALAAGIGGAWLLDHAAAWGRLIARHRPRFGLAPVAAAASLLIIPLACRIAIVAPRADARSDQSAYLYATQGVESLLPGAVVISHGDGRTFSLWYGAEVLFRRTDVAILYDNLLDWSWYREHVERRHAGLVLPPRQWPSWLKRGALIEGHLDRRPVYVTDLEPELAALYRIEPAGPLYRVVERTGRAAD
jgi:hypothetical protein